MIDDYAKKKKNCFPTSTHKNIIIKKNSNYDCNQYRVLFSFNQKTNIDKVLQIVFKK